MRYQIAVLLGVFIHLSLRSSDAKPTPNETVRLVGGSSDLEGRVEVYHDELWGTVCSDKFDDDDAKVLCHMLGFDRVGARAYGNARFGEGSGMIWLDNLGCIEMNDVEFEGNFSVMLNCTVLSIPTNGRFSPEMCQSEAVFFGSVCRLVCDPGYQCIMCAAENITMCSSNQFKCFQNLKTSNTQDTVCSDTKTFHDTFVLTSICYSDVDECLTKNGGCQYTCMNTEGSYTCSCESGYQLNHDLHTCTDVDECSTKKGGCQHTCTNTCSCKSGYLLNRDHQTCRDIDECFTENGGCRHTCINTKGSFTCSCDSGYQLNQDHHTCTDIDECSIDGGGCQHMCHNTKGSHICSCHPSYRLGEDNRSCVDRAMFVISLADIRVKS